jgi:hypothetical protein
MPNPNSALIQIGAQTSSLLRLSVHRIAAHLEMPMI